MNTNKLILGSAVASILGVAAAGTQAAMLMNNDHLSLTAGIAVYNSNGSVLGITSGSYFAVDTNGNNQISDTEKRPLSQGTTGIYVGQTTSPGASHSGEPTAGDSNEIDAPWNFFGNTGSTFTTIGITGGTTSGLDMSGWKVTWAGIPFISMASGAWSPATGPGHTGTTGTFSNGVANFYWSGVNGDSYSLDYRATVSNGDPSGTGGTQWEWHLEGIVTAAVPVVPIPAAAWLLGSGLLGLIGVRRRKVTSSSMHTQCG